VQQQHSEENYKFTEAYAKASLWTGQHCSLYRNVPFILQKRQHLIRPTFVSDEMMMMSSADNYCKGSWISVTSNEGYVYLPLMSYVGFSQFTLSLLQGNGNVSLSFKWVLQSWLWNFWLDISKQTELSFTFINQSIKINLYSASYK